MFDISLQQVKNLQREAETDPPLVWQLRFYYRADLDASHVIGWLTENGISYSRHRGVIPESTFAIIWAETPDDDVAALMRLRWL